MLRSFTAPLGLALGLVLGLHGPAFGQLRSTLVVSGLSRPVAFVQDPSDPSVQMVVEQGGRVRVLVNGALQASDFLDLTGQVSSVGEQGLFGIAFAPDYASSGRVFASFTNTSGHSVVARFNRSASDPLRVDPSTRFDLVWYGQPFIAQPASNHNGGHIAFGPDGFLYFGLGDGGSGNDPNHLAQNPTTLLGKMLRIDVAVADAHPTGYAVPPDNPYVGIAPVLGEIWAFGLRNPWRWSFDDPALGGTGALVIADVGQSAWEEINYEPSGAGGRNYGWRNREGAHVNVDSLPAYPGPLTDPIWEYPRDIGRSITGGVVYRGSALGPAYFGRYFFGDFVTSGIWSLALQVNGTTGAAVVTSIGGHSGDLGDASASPSSFGTDAAGELYVVSYAGAIYRIDPAQAAPNAGGCTTVQPGADWTCHNGGWLPPGIAPAGSPSPPPPPAPPTGTGGCTTVQPGADWTCHNGGWLPPGLVPPATPPAPPAPVPPPPPPSPSACTSVRPGADWTCHNGGWLPPGIAPPAAPPPAPAPPAPGPSAGCSSVQPGPDWVCRQGNWLPPGHPGAV